MRKGIFMKERMLGKGLLLILSRDLVLMSSTAGVVVFALILWLIRPGLLAAQIPPGLTVPAKGEPWKPPPPSSPAELQLSEALAALAEKLASFEREITADPDASPDSVKELRARIAELHRVVGENFQRLGRDLPQELRSRHQQADAAYRRHMKTLSSNLDALTKARTPAERAQAAQAAHEHLRSERLARPHQLLDPDKLPMGRARNEKRPPRTSSEELSRLVSPLSGAVPGKSVVLSAKAVTPQPEDLQENKDVQITSEIEALAAELDNDPIAIYQWVHDNVDFIPTYGSIQGSQMTLQSKRGNAFDTAALLAALLRASGVPTRFVVGTVEVPVALVTNWLGGVGSPQVAQQVLGQGGIPNVGLLGGGELTHIRIEHVWIQAWVDYVPGRGAKPQEGDTWVPLDASFKQHELTAPAGLFGAQPFDLAGLADQLLANADEIDNTLGKIKGIDEDLILSTMTLYEEDAGDFFQTTGIAPTRQAFLGKRKILPETTRVLAASLPFRVVAESEPVATLPDSLRLGVTLNGFSSAFEQALGNPSFSFTLSLPELNSRRLGVSYEPATELDAQIIQDALDSDATSLPLYLIDVKPVITLDGEAVATGPSVGMGATQLIDVALKDVSGTSVVPYQVIAGDEMVFGINANGITEEVVQARFDSVAPDTAAENLHQTALHFWMESDFFNEVTAESLGVFVQRRPSVGLFGSPLTVSFLFGTPRSGFYISRFMDVKRSFVGVAGEDPEIVRSFIQSSGKQTSFLEGLVLDQLFSEDGIAAGFSAMELIGDANRRGIPIYFITSENSAAVLPLLAVSTAVRNDIVNAVATGKTVLIPEREMSRGDWTGVGYIVEDEETGAAAYLISGGLNGGGRLECERDLKPLVRLILIVLLALILILIIIAIIKSLGTLGPVAQPALVSIILLLAILTGTSPAYAGGGFRKGGQADPWKCPAPPPPPPCQYDVTHNHGPCILPVTHWHYFVVNQGPAPGCVNRTSRLFGGCGPPPVPCPPC